jgi:hypothetical protein
MKSSFFPFGVLRLIAALAIGFVFGTALAQAS